MSTTGVAHTNKMTAHIPGPPIRAQLAKLLPTCRLGIEEDFEALWAVYDVGPKQPARLIYLKINPSEQLAAEILMAAKVFMRTKQAQDGYAPHLRRWLHNEEWEFVADV